ncbi:unnamed protein product [Chrysoparadoxa australica]
MVGATPEETALQQFYDQHLGLDKSSTAKTAAQGPGGTEKKHFTSKVEDAGLHGLSKIQAHLRAKQLARESQQGLSSASASAPASSSTPLAAIGFTPVPPVEAAGAPALASVVAPLAVTAAASRPLDVDDDGEEGRKRARVMTKAKVEVSTELNKTAFPPSNLLFSKTWDSTTAQGPLRIALGDFGYEANQTLVMRLTVPDDSSMWCFNICPEAHGEWTNSLFHFNPRLRQWGGVLVTNSREGGRWGTVVRESLAKLKSNLFKRTFDLAVQINSYGFHVAIDTEYSISFMPRTAPQPGSLWLDIPTADDNNNPENVTVHQVWWGKKPALPNMPVDPTQAAQG